MKLAIENHDAKRTAPKLRIAGFPGIVAAVRNRGVCNCASRLRYSGGPLLLLVVVERLPETNPNIEQTQAAAQAAEEAIGDYRAESGEREQ